MPGRDGERGSAGKAAVGTARRGEYPAKESAPLDNTPPREGNSGGSPADKSSPREESCSALPADGKLPRARRAFGDEGEDAACRYLSAKGYDILRRNFKGAHGEIDIIARRGETLVFAEVKTRSFAGPPSAAFGRPAAAVTREKRAHLISAAEEFLRGCDCEGVREMRFDVIEVNTSPAGPASLNHIENAFHK